MLAPINDLNDKDLVPQISVSRFGTSDQCVKIWLFSGRVGGHFAMA